MANQKRWGHITRLKVIEEPCMYAGPNGMYHGGDYYEVYLLRCDCGHEWKVNKRDFAGEYTVRNCGRPECEYANAANTKAVTIGRPPGRPPGIERGMNVQVYMPVGLYLQLTERKRDSVSMSKQIVTLIRFALDTQDALAGVENHMTEHVGGLVPVAEEPTDW